VPIPTSIALTRPEPADPAGPLDDRFYDLVEERFRRLLADNPVVATYLGVHSEDERLGDGSLDALLGELEAEKRHLTAVEALDPAGLSAEASFERGLELHNVRRSIFDTEVLRIWERRSTALDGVGDAIFLLFARDHAPFPDRLMAIGSRLEALPTYLDEHRTRATGPQVRLWQNLELETARDLPSFFDEIVAAAGTHLPATGTRRIERAATAAREAIADYSAWLRGSMAGGRDDWAIGRATYDELVGLRAFDGLDSDAILEIGHQQLADNLAARAEAASQIDPSADEAVVIDRIKSDHPAEFAEALEAYRVAMVRARQHLVDHRIVTVPDDDRLEVIATPDYLRNVIPFAAYFETPKFDVDPIGIYIVTPAVNDDPNAMREHNYSAISNTSIHEAYPGHHLQLSVATRHPSLTRLLAGAPEFVEGWGMYCEQMMREQGFDDAPSFRLGMATDAIWRACRIILDIRMHRGEIGVDEATAFLVEQTKFEEANARAEVNRYTYTPTYPLSYMLGKVLLLELRADETRRLGDHFSLQAFHDALLRHGSLPISFHRRLLAAGATAATGGR
jgi:uncharacterized protein (DUF885 family)